MSLRVCPIATIDAPAERVGTLLAHPVRYAEWWDARTRYSIIPEGLAQPGQQILAWTTALGTRWDIHIFVQAVQAVAPEKRHLDLLTRLPFGITVYNHITCARLDDQHTRVSFG
jgi:hypothetical protein